VITIGVHVHEQPQLLLETVVALRIYTAPGFELLLLPDGADSETRAALARVSDLAQSPNNAPQGPAACLNRLARETTADTLILLESGTIVSPDWLDKILAALQADPRHGLASPSTNRAWNQLAAFPNARGDEAGIAGAAAEADARFGQSWKSLAPLWDVGDFCLAVKRSVIDHIGPADEAYGLGPCWEMDYAVRAVRAGFLAVWAQGAYVFRHPFTLRREREEARLFEANRNRYQDRFCGLRLSRQPSTYAQHCRGETCSHFAPPGARATGSVVALADPPRAAGVPDAPAASAPAAEPPAATPATSINTAPLVSCIMPTKGRPDWARQAIHYFQTQDYPNLELIIVDASPGNLVAQIPDDPRIRRHRVPARSSIGAMRNIACDLARGDVIIHWDDDDWYAPTRVSAQVPPILDGTADITGLHDTRFFEVDSWRFWRCSPALHAKLFVRDVHGGTLAFRRSLHGPNCRYPDLSLAEDAQFLHCAMTLGARLHRINGTDLFMYLRHRGNAWRLQCGSYLDPRGWRPDAEPGCLMADRAFYAARTLSAAPLGSPGMPPLSPASVAEASGRTAIGVYVHAEPQRLRATLAALKAHTPPDYELLLLPDGPDHAVRAALADLPYLSQSPTDVPLGAAACFNRLVRETTGETVILLESGTIVAPGWLEKLLAALTADPAHGIASPSTNRAWNRLAAFPHGTGEALGLARTAAEADVRFGQSWQSLAPLWDTGDFCIAVKRAAIEAAGPADEAYGEGPCWEMDYAIRVVRAGFVAVWARGAYVFRHPATARRQREEALRFEASRQRYQDKFCGLRLSGARAGYSRHCRGEACAHFAPTGSKPLASAIRSAPPFVSCIMPTANRRRFVPDAIALFLALDYPNAELVVLDDGEDAVGDLMPSDPSVRYLRGPRHRSLGAKRNAACEVANGEIILHWDDDDWYAPHRVRLQVEALRATGADVCGLDRVLFYDPRVLAAWEYVYPASAVPWVYGATLCYRRDYWRMHPFPNLTVGEDNAFAATARAGELLVLPDNRFFVALVHAGNTSAKNVRDPRWRPYDAASVRALTGTAWPAANERLNQYPGGGLRQTLDSGLATLPPPSATAPGEPVRA
jgi:glycosyltransferase involved in cell wall biosynthesis/GT2 family glycosyltransferase